MKIHCQFEKCKKENVTILDGKYYCSEHYDQIEYENRRRKIREEDDATVFSVPDISSSLDGFGFDSGSSDSSGGDFSGGGGDSGGGGSSGDF